MTTTPLYTAAELTTEIELWKSAIRALAISEEYTVALPDGSRTTVRRPALPQIEARLDKLQAMRVQASVGNGPQSIQGRVYRG
jgi:hypothetical protein